MSRDVKERWYDIILGPLVTEKALQGASGQAVKLEESYRIAR